MTLEFVSHVFSSFRSLLRGNTVMGQQSERSSQSTPIGARRLFRQHLNRLIVGMAVLAMGFVAAAPAQAQLFLFTGTVQLLPETDGQTIDIWIESSGQSIGGVNLRLQIVGEGGSALAIEALDFFGDGLNPTVWSENNPEPPTFNFTPDRDAVEGIITTSDLHPILTLPDGASLFARLIVDTTGYGDGAMFELLFENLFGNADIDSQLLDPDGNVLSVAFGVGMLAVVPEPREYALWMGGLCIVVVYLRRNGFWKWRGSGSAICCLLAGLVMTSVLDAKASGCIDVGAHVARPSDEMVKVRIKAYGPITFSGINLRFELGDETSQWTIQDIQIRGTADNRFILPPSDPAPNVIKTTRLVEVQWVDSSGDGRSVHPDGGILAELTIAPIGAVKGSTLVKPEFSEWGLVTELLDASGEVIPCVLKPGSIEEGPLTISLHRVPGHQAVLAGTAFSNHPDIESSDATEMSWKRVGGVLQESAPRSIWDRTDMGVMDSGLYRFTARAGDSLWEGPAVQIEVFESEAWGLRVRPDARAVFVYLPSDEPWSLQHSSILADADAWATLALWDMSVPGVFQPSNDIWSDTEGFFRVEPAPGF